MEPKDVPLTPEQINELRYQFGGLRYGIRGPDACGSDEIVAQEVGLFAFPKQDQAEEGSGEDTEE